MEDLPSRLAEVRTEYDRGGLSRADLPADPLVLLARWVDESLAASPADEPTAMTLATVDAEGRPSSRVVLLKGIEDGALVFYTNYRSRKGRELEARPVAAATFWWPAMERQVRVTGPVERLPAATSDAYFATRPRGSQIAAWASPQSEVVPDRASLEARRAELEARWDGREVPRPPHWGGFRLVPAEVEAWQGRPNRLHDRFRWAPTADGGWLIERLAP